MTRDDYRELAESALYLLGGINSKFWRKPGATHKARFCAFGIYAMRAFAFGDQLDLDEQMLEDLGRFCQFLTTVYIPHFFSSPIGADAPYNDLNLYKKLQTYRCILFICSCCSLFILIIKKLPKVNCHLLT